MEFVWLELSHTTNRCYRLSSRIKHTVSTRENTKSATTYNIESDYKVDQTSRTYKLHNMVYMNLESILLMQQIIP